MAPNTNKMKMLRVVVREDFSRSRCDVLICDIKLCLGLLEESDKETVKRQEEYIKTHLTASGRAQESIHTPQHFKVRFAPVFWPFCSTAADTSSVPTFGISVIPRNTLYLRCIL
jgi:hypothetical protein